MLCATTREAPTAAMVRRLERVTGDMKVDIKRKNAEKQETSPELKAAVGP